MDLIEPGTWGVNAGRFIDHYKGWLITGRARGPGWSARRRNAEGRPRGPRLEADTLDELAALIDAAGG